VNTSHSSENSKFEITFPALTKNIDLIDLSEETDRLYFIK